MRVPNDELRKNLACPRYNPYNRYHLLIATTTDQLVTQLEWELVMPSSGSSHRSQTLDAWAVPATP
jgi:hypothetical protein